PVSSHICVYYSLYTTITFIFFSNDPSTTEIYTLSLHDALPISRRGLPGGRGVLHRHGGRGDADPRARRPVHRRRHAGTDHADRRDRKSTRLNSSHVAISYAVFCLKKKNKL